MYLEVFHAAPTSDSTSKLHKQVKITSSWPFYIFITAVLLFWAASIPYTRFLMGAHSLDQIVYGSTLGVWTALFMHFLVRDHAIRFFEKTVIW